MKHIICWSDEGDLIIDATSGSGTFAVRTHFLMKIWLCRLKISTLLTINIHVFQVSAAWVSFDSITMKCRKIIKQSEDWSENILSFDHYLRSYRSRHIILIEEDLRQFNGQKLRIQQWESLCTPVRECDTVGNFNLISDIFKSKQGKTIK